MVGTQTYRYRNNDLYTISVKSTRCVSHGYQQPSLDVFQFAHLLGQIHDADLVFDVLLPLSVPRAFGRLVVLLPLDDVRLVALLLLLRRPVVVVVVVVVMTEVVVVVIVGTPHLFEVLRRSQALHVPVPERQEV